MSQPPVAVALVSWNNRDLLAAALRSLQPEHDAGRAQVWVVDNASSDGSPDLVREEFPWVSLVASDENLGFGRAVNVVARRTSSRWLAAGNDDVELRPGALERMLSTAEADPGVGAVAPRLLLRDGSTQHSVQSFPSIALGLVTTSGVCRLAPALGDRLCLPGYWNPERRRAVPWAMAAWLLVRREAWEEAGGFDEAQWMYAEDLDLGWRLRERGWKTVYEPDAVVLHADRAASTKAFGNQVLSRHMQASYEWMARRLGPRRARAIALLNAAGSAVRLLAFGALAAVRPGRFAARRDEQRLWLGLHMAGVRTRRS